MFTGEVGMGSVEAVHRAIRLLYQAALNPDHWPVALAAITQTVGTHRGMLLAESASAPSLCVPTGFSAEHGELLQTEFETRLPDWIQAIPVGAVVRQTSMITDADFRRSCIYNEAIRPAGGFYGIIAPLVRAGERQAYLCAGRNLGEPDFTEQDEAALGLIVPHLLTALEIRGRIQASDLRTHCVYESIGQLNVGVVLLDAWMRPVFVNGRAETIAAANDGLLLHTKKLSASCPADASTLREMVARAIAFNHSSRDASESAVHHPAMRCYLSRKPPRPPLIVTVVPVQDAGVGIGMNCNTRAILFVVTPELVPAVEPLTPATTYRLTQRESQIAGLLASGLALDEAASELGIGVGTARGYLKQIMAKTGTHRQGELISLLLRGVLPCT